MTLEILSPERTLYSGEVERVTLPGALGEFTVLRRHAPIISALVKGEVKYLLKDGKEEKRRICKNKQSKGLCFKTIFKNCFKCIKR